MKSVSVMPILASVLRIVGQVPSPTPPVATLVDYTRVTRTPLPERLACAASRQAAILPADPPPTTMKSNMTSPGVARSSCQCKTVRDNASQGSTGLLAAVGWPA
jgi:hypothetical protein